MPTKRGLSIPGYDYPYTVSGRTKDVFIDIENDEPWYISYLAPEQKY